MKKNKFLISILSSLIFVCCKSYTISTESFKKQMINANTANQKKVEVNNPLIGFNQNIKYYSNNLNGLQVMDKQGETLYLANSPSIEMRVTLKNGKKRIFYFDTVFVENDIVKGSQSRFIKKTREIPMDSIIKIEVQDGGKKFDYQN